MRVLSGGQRSRLGLLEIMLMQHNFLVLDEPSNHLDLDSIDIVEEGLRHFDGTLLLVSHDRQLLSRAVNKLLVITGGRTRLFHGGYEEYVQALHGEPLWSEITQLEAARHRAHEIATGAASAPVAASARPPAAPAAEEPRVSKNVLARLRGPDAPRARPGPGRAFV